MLNALTKPVKAILPDWPEWCVCCVAAKRNNKVSLSLAVLFIPLSYQCCLVLPMIHCLIPYFIVNVDLQGLG